MEKARSQEEAEALAKERQSQLRETCADIFKDRESCVFELGCGHGHFLTAYAEKHPEQFCIGIDLISKRVSKGTSKQNKRSLDNLLFLKAEGKEFISALPPEVWFERVFILFPDPWPKKKHHKRRIMQDEFLSNLAKRCRDTSELCFRTDHKPYFEWSVEKIEEHEDWSIKSDKEWPFEGTSFFQEILPDFQSLIAVKQ